MMAISTGHSGDQVHCRCRKPAHCHPMGHCHGQVGARRQGPGCKGRKRVMDNCDDNPCDGPCDISCRGPGCCDFGLFSTLLTLGSVVAGVAGRSGRGRVVGGPGPLDRVGVAGIRGYRRWLSHRWPGRCRYTPTCSAYGLAAVDRYGLAVGGRLAAARLRRCRPEVPFHTPDPLP